jgi:polyisoprenoid-binding protein YceI
VRRIFSGMNTTTNANATKPNETEDTKTALWTLDPIHTTVGFSVRHLMITNVHGVFEKASGTLKYDPAHPERAQLEVTIAADSVHTREPQRDGHLRSADFFDAANHPTITFRSKRVRRSGDAGLEVKGDLTMRGTTREVTLAVNELTGEHPDYQGARRIGASATTKVRRSEFGMTFNKVVDAGGVGIGDEVSITIDASLVKSAEA